MTKSSSARTPFLLFTLTIVFLQTPSHGQILDEDLPSTNRPTDLTISGRVVDAEGRGIANSEVLVTAAERARSARPLGVYIRNGLPFMIETLGPVKTDSNGGYSIDVPKCLSGLRSGLDVYASARGYGYTTQQLKLDGNQNVDLRLGAEHVVRGKLIDLKGKPVADAKILVLLHKPGANQSIGGWWKSALKGWHPSGLSIWKPVHSDDKGRFIVRGLNDKNVALQFEHRKSTTHYQAFETTSIEKDDRVSVALSPARTITGVVTYEDTGAPVANARIIVPADHLGFHWTETRTGEDGSYAVNPFGMKSFSGRTLHILNIFPPKGMPYVIHQENLPESRAARREVNIKLKRGVRIHGTVTEESTGKPIAGARIQSSYAYIDAVSPIAAESSRLLVAISDADGKYELAVPPEKSNLYVLAPTLDYATVQTSYGEMKRGKPGEKRFSLNAFERLEFEKGEVDKRLDFVLRRGLTLRAKVLGADGAPVKSFVAFSPSYNPNGYCHTDAAFLHGKNGAFSIPGCDEDSKHRVSIYDHGSKLGATVWLDASHANQPAVVRLKSCGKATVRIVDTQNQPLVGYRPHVGFIINEGVIRTGNYSKSPEFLDYGAAGWLHPKTYGGLRTDAKGQITFPILIPGVKYQFSWMPNQISWQDRPVNMPQFTFDAEAGKHEQLGDLVLKDYLERKRN